LRQPNRSPEGNDRPFLVSQNHRPIHWSGRRLKVVRRDRYRCRGCDRKGDEVTLDVHPIHPEASEVDAMLSLCPSCRELANTLHLSSSHIPDFLRQLWGQLLHSTPTTGTTQKNFKSAVDSTLLPQIQTNPQNETPYQFLQQGTAG
jgi:hypothetical protein